MGIGNFHIGIMGNLFSGKTTLMNAMTAEPYRSELPALVGGAELYSFTERVEKDSLTDRCLKLFYQDRVANIFATEVAFLNMRVHQQREIRRQRNVMVAHEGGELIQQPADAQALQRHPVKLVDETVDRKRKRFFVLKPSVRGALIAAMARSGARPAQQDFRGQPVDAVVTKLLESVQAWCQPKGPLDDVSILGIEWNGT